MPDDELTPNPYETEKAASKVLKKMQGQKNVEEAVTREAVEKREAARQKLRDMGYIKSGGIGGGGGADMEGPFKMGTKRKPDYKKGGKVTASKRADGCAKRGKTRGRIV